MRTRESRTCHTEADVDDVLIIHFDLDELVAGITDEKRHDLIDLGEPVGREVW